MIWFRYLLWAFLISGLTAVPGKAAEQTAGSDAQKKAIIYQMYFEYKQKDFPGIDDIPPREAMRLRQAGRVIFIDTRSPEEMAVSMLPGAVSKQQFLQNPDRFQDAVLIAYCTISYRSGIFVRKMKTKNISIKNLQGGLLGWVLEGGKVYDGKDETRRIHVYSRKWDYPPAGYRSVYFGWFERLFN